MTTRTSAQALADAASNLVQRHDVTSVLAQLVQDAAQFIPADAAAFLARTADGAFELLSASSHRAVELELYQSQANTGPCIDASRTGSALAVVGREQLVSRWPDVGRAISAPNAAWPRGCRLWGSSVWFTLKHVSFPLPKGIVAWPQHGVCGLEPLMCRIELSCLLKCEPAYTRMFKIGIAQIPVRPQILFGCGRITVPFVH